MVTKFFGVFQEHILQNCDFYSDILLVNPKQYDPSRWFSLQKIQFSKIFIIRYYDAIFIISHLQQRCVIKMAVIVRKPDNIVSSTSQKINNPFLDIYIRKEFQKSQSLWLFLIIVS